MRYQRCPRCKTEIVAYRRTMGRCRCKTDNIWRKHRRNAKGEYWYSSPATPLSGRTADPEVLAQERRVAARHVEEGLAQEAQSSMWDHDPLQQRF